MSRPISPIFRSRGERRLENRRRVDKLHPEDPSGSVGRARVLITRRAAGLINASSLSFSSFLFLPPPLPVALSLLSPLGEIDATRREYRTHVFFNPFGGSVLSLGSNSVFLGGILRSLNVSRYIHGASISLHVNRTIPNVPCLRCNRFFFFFPFYLKRNPRNSIGDFDFDFANFDSPLESHVLEFIDDPKNISNRNVRNVSRSEFYNKCLFNLRRAL